MKKLLLLLICSAFALHSHAQQKIIGIGKLKLGSPVSVISDIGYTKEPKKVSTNTAYLSNVFKNFKGDEVYILLSDTTLKDNIAVVPVDNRVSVYYLPSYAPIEGIMLKGLTLKFLNGSLYSINIKEEDGLKEAFDLKYGESELDVKEDEMQYTNEYGRKITKIDEGYTSTWTPDDKSIMCHRYITKYHTDKGEERYTGYFLLQDTKIAIEVAAADKENQKRTKERQEKEKKKGLEEL